MQTFLSAVSILILFNVVVGVITFGIGLYKLRKMDKAYQAAHQPQKKYRPTAVITASGAYA
jgi:hypothetical protein